ncbi:MULTISPECIES: glycosyltransferase family 2 protein [Aphanothece]|uniref:glycosyltransferase family 2 protein n=1 Tax=Aphanothece TaxID=1121 RepID=UPI003984A1FD
MPIAAPGVPQVTFVIATYKRVDALRSTLRALQLQSVSDWEAIVVGDCCEPETGQMLSALAEPRVRYYNLTQRFGEQSGPNSFGLALARAPVVCFLNHDDILLRDHLEMGLPLLRQARADLLIAPALKLVDCHQDADGTIRPVFMKRITVAPPLQDLRMLLRPEDLYYDPSSFWLVRTAFARQVGPWTHSSRLWRTPLRDWLLRAWRRGGRFVFGGELVGIRVVTHNHRPSRRRYNARTPEHQRLVQLLAHRSPDQFRDLIPPHLHQNAQELARPLQASAAAPGGARVTPALKLKAWLFRLVGLDWQVLRWRWGGVERGAFHSRLLRLRTGEAIAAVPDLQPLLADPERYRIL